MLTIWTYDWVPGDADSPRGFVRDPRLRQALRGGLPGYPVIRAYIERACARPAFNKARADQPAHFAAGDQTRK